MFNVQDLFTFGHWIRQKWKRKRKNMKRSNWINVIAINIRIERSLSSIVDVDLNKTMTFSMRMSMFSFSHFVYLHIHVAFIDFGQINISQLTALLYYCIVLRIKSFHILTFRIGGFCFFFSSTKKSLFCLSPDSKRNETKRLMESPYDFELNKRNWTLN